MSGILDDAIYWNDLERSWKQLSAAYERANSLRIYDLDDNEVQPVLKQFLVDVRRATLQISIECEKETIRQVQIVTVESTAKIEVWAQELSEL